MIGTLFPALRYADPNAAVDWLCKAFGFEEHAVFRGENGQVEHAELRLGNSMIMLGPAKDDEFRWKTPSALGGVVTHVIYAYVEDADAHYARAKAAGAEIVRDIDDMPYGSREYSARDPEGFVWSFGTYLPSVTSD